MALHLENSALGQIFDSRDVAQAFEKRNRLEMVPQQRGDQQRAVPCPADVIEQRGSLEPRAPPLAFAPDSQSTSRP
jgi:hypothetical protein